MTEGIGFKLLFCVLVLGSLLVGGCRSIFRQGNLRDVEVAYGIRPSMQPLGQAMPSI